MALVFLPMLSKTHSLSQSVFSSSKSRNKSTVIIDDLSLEFSSCFMMVEVGLFFFAGGSIY